MPTPPRIRRLRKSRAKHARVYLGVGEFAWTDSELGPQKAARRFFLEAVIRLRPSILTQLQRDALGLCRALLEANPGGVSPEDWEEIADTQSRRRLSAEATSLREAVRAWAERWHLTDVWVREDALSSLEVWAHGWPLTVWWPRPQAGMTAEVEPFTYPGWDAGYERWSEWEGRFRRKLSGTLAEYRTLREAYLRKVGMIPTTTKLQAHFVWLARHQVLGESMGEVARRVGIKDRSTVRAAVHAIASLAGLTLRAPTRGGRPPRKHARYQRK